MCQVTERQTIRGGPNTYVLGACGFARFVFIAATIKLDEGSRLFVTVKGRGVKLRPEIAETERGKD